MKIKDNSIVIYLRGLSAGHQAPRLYSVNYTMCADEDDKLCCSDSFEYVSEKGSGSEDDLFAAIEQAITDRETSMSAAKAVAKGEVKV